MSMRKRLRRVSVVKVAAALAVILLIYPVTIHIVRACVRAETIASPSLRSLSPETGDIGLEDGLVEIAREGGYRVAIDTQTLDVQITDEGGGAHLPFPVYRPCGAGRRQIAADNPVFEQGSDLL